MYMIGVRVAASFQPSRSAGPTNSREHRARSAPMPIPQIPSQPGATVVWVNAMPTRTLQVQFSR
jgi:hypothetical protein